MVNIQKIDEANKLISPKELKRKKATSNQCVYYPESVCNPEKAKFKLCEKCGRVQVLQESNVMKNLFQHVKALAISLFSHMGGTGGGGVGGQSSR